MSAKGKWKCFPDRNVASVLGIIGSIHEYAENGCDAIETVIPFDWVEDNGIYFKDDEEVEILVRRIEPEWKDHAISAFVKLLREEFPKSYKLADIGRTRGMILSASEIEALEMVDSQITKEGL